MSQNMRIAVILPAAGRGRRFGAGSKLEVDLAGRPVLLRSVGLFAGRGDVAQLIVAADPDDLDAFRFKWADRLGLMAVKIVAGGRAERWETVANALSAVEDGITHIAVHDAARPVADARMIDRVFAAARRHAAVVPAIPVDSTLKRIDPEPIAGPAEPKFSPDASGSGAPAGGDPLDAILGPAGGGEADPADARAEAHRVVETVPREHLWLAQTPQVFQRELIERAYRGIAEGSVDTGSITDDAALVEAMGEPVVAVPGDRLNVKLTQSDDVAFAEAVLRLREGRAAGDALGSKRKFPTWAQSEED